MGAPILIALVLWATRTAVTDVVVRQYFAARGVAAQARAAEVGRDRLVFEDVRLGPATAPEFSAHRITVDLGWSRLAPAIRAVRLDGARLRVHADANGVSFGTLDNLIPPGRSTRFPAVRLEAPGAIVRVATPVGTLTWRVDGRGRLDHDFRAAGTLAPAVLQSVGCGATLPAAVVVVTTKTTNFAVTSSGMAHNIFCRATVSRIAWALKFSAPLSMETFTASMKLDASKVDFGMMRSRASNVLATIAGSLASVSGHWRVVGSDVGSDRDHAAGVDADGRLMWRRGGTVNLDGTGEARSISSATMAGAWPRTEGWSRLVAGLVERGRAASHLLSARARFSAAIGDRVAVRVFSLDAAGATGARLHFAGGALGWTPAGLAIDGIFDGGGGGLPTTRVIVVPTSSGFTGSFELGPWREGGNALAATGGRFALIGSRATVAASVNLSSDFAGGRVDGLRFPLALAFDRTSGAIAIGDACTPFAVQRIAVGASTVAASTFILCPVKTAPLLMVNSGRLVADVAIAASDFRGVMTGRGFVLATRPLRLQLRGTTASPTLSTPAATLTATIAGWRGTATVAGLVTSTRAGWSGIGRISAAGLTGPAVVARDGVADWQLARAALMMTNAGATMIDTSPAPRFAPLRIAGVSAEVDAGHITGRGKIGLAGGAPLATVTGMSDIANATGTATVDSALTFSPSLQPVQISELVRGVAANVAGVVTTHADLQFGPAGIRGSAQIRLTDLALATAALGPISGINGTITFDDVPRLHTPPKQILRIDSIDPGVRVDDAIVEFQVLDAGSVRAERIAWPFTGGTMTVQPTIIRAGEAHRNFNVVVDGLDAAQFLQRFELKNLSATGRFDGVLPLVFDGAAGRIDGGVLTARSDGGLLQYVGNVGQESMGAAGRLAFDALRRLRYRTLAIRLDGDLDGELVTGIDFTGTNEVPVRPGGALPIHAAGLPFKFGVTVRAPFRALLGTAASFSDARTAIRMAKPAP